MACGKVTSKFDGDSSAGPKCHTVTRCAVHVRWSLIVTREEITSSLPCMAVCQ